MIDFRAVNPGCTIGMVCHQVGACPMQKKWRFWERRNDQEIEIHIVWQDQAFAIFPKKSLLVYVLLFSPFVPRHLSPNIASLSLSLPFSPSFVSQRWLCVPFIHSPIRLLLGFSMEPRCIWSGPGVVVVVVVVVVRSGSGDSSGSSRRRFVVVLVLVLV